MVAARRAFRTPSICTEPVLAYMDRTSASALAGGITVFARPAFDAQSVEALDRAFASVSARSGSHFLFSSRRATASFLSARTTCRP